MSASAPNFERRPRFRLDRTSHEPETVSRTRGAPGAMGSAAAFTPSLAAPVALLLVVRGARDPLSFRSAGLDPDVAALVDLRDRCPRLVPLSAISPALLARWSLLGGQSFLRPSGVDWDALREVIEEADEDGLERGASTIAMQTARNVFLWQGRSYIRKGLEIPLALDDRYVWSKRRVMEVYLNIAEWGDGVFGAEAAARHYFRKSAGSCRSGRQRCSRQSSRTPSVAAPASPPRSWRVEPHASSRAWRSRT